MKFQPYGTPKTFVSPMFYYDCFRGRNFIKHPKDIAHKHAGIYLRAYAHGSIFHCGICERFDGKKRTRCIHLGWVARGKALLFFGCKHISRSYCFIPRDSDNVIRTCILHSNGSSPLCSRLLAQKSYGFQNYFTSNKFAVFIFFSILTNKGQRTGLQTSGTLHFV